MAKQKKVLYFVDGALPTNDDLKAMKKLSGTYQVCQRNAQRVPSDGALEACDFVSGTVPERYHVAYDAKGKAEVYTTEFDPADALDALGNDLTVEDAEDQSTLAKAVTSNEGHSGLALGTDPFQTPATTSPRLQTAAVDNGKAVPLVDATGWSTGAGSTVAAKATTREDNIATETAKAANTTVNSFGNGVGNAEGEKRTGNE